MVHQQVCNDLTIHINYQKRYKFLLKMILFLGVLSPRGWGYQTPLKIAFTKLLFTSLMIVGRLMHPFTRSSRHIHTYVEKLRRTVTYLGFTLYNDLSSTVLSLKIPDKFLLTHKLNSKLVIERCRQNQRYRWTLKYFITSAATVRS